jgi:pimeloyl-[acyl-carrier protein] methyl ester esterase
VLHVEVTGRGEPLLLLHGWGMHGGVWQEVAEPLANAFRVCAVDLPGHGYSVDHGSGGARFTLDAVTDALSASFQERVSVLGWSLGGIIAQHWALRHPDQVARLILVASTPCFARRADWDHGMPQETLGQFAADFEHDFMATLRRFLALQVRGAEGERETLAALRARLFSRGEPDPAALRQGLAILRDADLRGNLGRLAQPALVIGGDRDRLTPPQASRYLAQAMPNAHLVEIAGAAHAPFLSHRDAFLGALRDFMSV